MTALDLDTRTKGTDGPFEAWEGDHTALVHVLWHAHHEGLTLEKDFDTIATMVMQSRFLTAHTAAAIDRDRVARAMAALRTEVDRIITEAERHEASATDERARETDAAGRGDDAEAARLHERAKKYERFAYDARDKARRLLERGPQL